MRPDVFKFLREKFFVKLFMAFTLIFLFAGIAAAFFFLRYESNSLSENLISRGRLLSETLAHNSRLGVFAENREQLKDIVDGVTKQESVEHVSIYNADGEILASSENPARDNGRTPVDSFPNLIDLVIKGKKTIIKAAQNSFGFWSPVISGRAYIVKDSVFSAESGLPPDGRVIGYTRIIIGKRLLNQKITVLIYRIILAAICFWALGSILMFIIGKSVTRPLNHLKEAVDQMGRTGDLGTISVETEDEIGDLAIAFNRMTETMQQREIEKTKLENKLRQAQKMEAIGTLAGGIAHDFNNILGAIMGFSELALLETPEDSPLHDKLNEILNAGIRGSDLVRQILTFSRQTEQKKWPLQASLVIKEVVKLLRPSLPSSIEIRQNIDPDSGLILSDATSIYQIIMNLCTNAAHSMKDRKGVLEIALCTVDIDPELEKKAAGFLPGRYQKITVTDSGHGIEPQNLDRIFDPFFTTKGAGEGTGMGLSVVHGIVKRHNGFVRVDSQPGQGTRFEVFIPLLETKSERKTDPEAVRETPRGNEVILIVDDERPLIQSTKGILEDLGYRAIGKTSGQEALNAFIKDPDFFNLVITDMAMPKMTGLELSRELLKIRPDIPIILLTGFSESINKETSAAFGLKEFVTKPVSRQELARIVRDVIDNARSTP